jgi:NADPH:quinone reductase-like Zn-dependent oxidoreductase
MDELTSAIIVLVITSVILWVSLKELVYRARLRTPERLPSVVLVTGAASGIGKEMVLSLAKRAIDARRQMTLVLWDIDQKGLGALGIA